MKNISLRSTKMPFLTYTDDDHLADFFTFSFFFKDFFDVDHFKNLFWICCSIVSVLCFVFFWSQDLWDLSSLTRDPICTPCIGRWSFNHRTTKEVPWLSLYQWFSINWWNDFMLFSLCVSLGLLSFLDMCVYNFN